MRLFPVYKLLIWFAIIAAILPCGAQEKSAPDPWQSQVNLEVKDLPIYDALQLLFKNSGINFTVAPEIGQLRVSAVLKNVNLTEALKAVVKAAGARYSLEKNIVVVSSNPAFNYANNQLMTQQAAPAPSARASGAVGAVGLDRTQKTVSRAVSLKNLNAGQVAPFIAKPGIQVLSTNTNQSVITGPEDQVKEAEDLIAALDRTDALPRPVRINVCAKATWNVDGRKPVVAVMNPSLSAAEGASGSFEVTADTKPSLDVPGMNVRFKMRAQSTVMSDGRISVAGSFAFEWVIKQGAINQVMFSSPDVPVTASLEPGKTQNVATIRMGAGREGRDAVLEVTLTASVEKGRINPFTYSPIAPFGTGR